MMTIDHEHSFKELDALAQDNYTCAKQCLQSLQQSHTIAVKSAETLHEQGDQIKRISGNVDTVHEQLDQSEKKLNVISSVFGNIQTWFQRIGRNSQEKKQNENSEILPVQPDQLKGCFITRHSRQQSKESGGEATDDVIDQVILVVSDLHEISIQMGKELDRQNQGLSDVERGVDQAIPRIKKAICITQQL
jgi:hypothetical protein